MELSRPAKVAAYVGAAIAVFIICSLVQTAGDSSMFSQGYYEPDSAILDIAMNVTFWPGWLATVVCSWRPQQPCSMSTDHEEPGVMNENTSPGRRAARAASGVAAELAAGVGVALLQFAILGVLLAAALALLVFVNPYVGFAFGAISFVVWSVKTGWVFL